MLKSVIDFFQQELKRYLAATGANDPEPGFPSPEGESIKFVKTGLNFMMVNLEEENTLRQADLFRHEKNGNPYSGLPEIRLNLYLLFIANMTDYKASMGLLSDVIRFFLTRRVFDHNNSPELPGEIEKLTAELVTLPFAQQNDVWNALRTFYKPSLLYKVRMVVFSPEPPVTPESLITEMKHDLNQKTN